MSSFSRDTTDEAAQVQRAVWRAMPRERKFRLTLDASSAMAEVACVGIRNRHPQYDERQVKMAWLRLTMGRAAFERCFPNVEVEP